MDADRSKQLAEFVEYVNTLDGDEKGEAQVFIDRLFRAFSRRGYKEAGATLEMRVKNDRGGTAFADLVWKPKVLIEMKKRGEDLSRHLIQAFDYWVRLVPGRPRYVVLCNFDEFRIYDFDININEPLDTIALAELPNRYGPLNFMWPTDERPISAWIVKASPARLPTSSRLCTGLSRAARALGQKSPAIRRSNAWFVSFLRI